MKYNIKTPIYYVNIGYDTITIDELKIAFAINGDAVSDQTYFVIIKRGTFANTIKSFSRHKHLLNHNKKNDFFFVCVEDFSNLEKPYFVCRTEAKEFANKYKDDKVSKLQQKINKLLIKKNKLTDGSYSN